MKKPNFNSYTTTIDFDVAGLYANERCKNCLGKGYNKTLTSSGGTFRKGDPVIENYSYCQCVYKNIEKYG